LPCVSKIIERIAHDQLTAYLNSSVLLNEHQSGFRKGYSTTTALLKVTNDIRVSINDGMVTVIVLLDFTKAFASMRHDFLIDKLVHHFGLSYPSALWFKSYLEERSQSVRVDDRCSAWRYITRGVPEGSILGPLLFSLFINDISDGILHCKYHLYADDCQIYHSFPVSEMERGLREINHDLSIINNWSSANGLLLNAKKLR
jgi:Reverse transcriptase (RNA-dependent DNA polymerase)